MSNLGSCLGTAIAGTVIVAGITATPERSYGLAMVVLGAASIGGLVAAVLLSRTGQVEPKETVGPKETAGSAEAAGSVEVV